MKIQIGAGHRPILGFKNYDIDDSHSQVHFASADDVPCDDHTVDLIFSNAFFEHVAPGNYECMFREWHRILSPNGSMVHMGIPWFDYVVYLYLQKQIISRDMLRNWVLGETHNHSQVGDFHKNLLNKEELKNIFNTYGFDPVKVYNYCYPGEDLAVNLCVVFGEIDLKTIPHIEEFMDLNSL